MSSTHRFTLLCAFVAFASLGVAPTAPAKEIAFRTISYNGDGAAPPGLLGTTGARIVRDEASAKAMFGAGAIERESEPIAKVDFRRRSLIAVVGAMGDPGYGIIPGSFAVSGTEARFTGTVFVRDGYHPAVISVAWVVLSVPREAVRGVATEVGVVLRCGPRHACSLRHRTHAGPVS